MKVEHKGHTTIIKNTDGNSIDFLEKLTNEYHSFQNVNLIVDLSHDKELSIFNVKLYTTIIKQHAKNKKSFVIVHDSIDYNAVPKNIVLVPTILEAHDIIEMDEIERDLGF
jgi:hypothetical protein